MQALPRKRTPRCATPLPFAADTHGITRLHTPPARSIDLACLRTLQVEFVYVEETQREFVSTMLSA